MLGQIFSSAALALTCNATSTTAIGWLGVKKQRQVFHRDDLIETIFKGVVFGALPSLCFELIGAGLKHGAPSLISKVPFPVSLTTRVVLHLAAPILGLFVCGVATDKSTLKAWGESICDFANTIDTKIREYIG